MCFIIKDQKDALIAKDNIICYKLLWQVPKESKRAYGMADYLSPFQLFRYNKFKTYYQRFKIKLKGKKYGDQINIGFHAFNSVKIAEGEMLTRKRLKNMRIVKCIIPKGAKYFKNKREIVSDKIIVREIVE